MSIVGRIKKPDRWGEGEYWTGEIELQIKRADRRQLTRFLVMPLKYITRSGANILSGTIYPSKLDMRRQMGEIARNAQSNTTVEVIFVSVTISSSGQISSYRDVIGTDYLGATEAAMTWEHSIHVEPKQGLFRKVVFRCFKKDLRVGKTDQLIEEVWVRVYNLSHPMVALSVPRSARTWAGKERKSIFYAGGDCVWWKNIDNDPVSELILVNADIEKNPAWIYKLENGIYRYLKHDSLKSTKYVPPSVNPEFKMTISVKDEKGMPIEGVDVLADVATKHSNIIRIWDEPKTRVKHFRVTTDDEGEVVLRGKCSYIDISLRKAGFVGKDVAMSAQTKPIPKTLDVVLKRE